MGAIPPSAILSRKGIARYGGVSRTGPLSPGPRHREIPDKKMYGTGSGRVVPGFGSGRPGFGKTLCLQSLRPATEVPNARH